MNRRDFVKFIAATAGGAALLPAQLEALERFYDLNTPQVATGLVAVDDVCLGGMATMGSMPSQVTFGFSDKDRVRAGINLYGGIFRWTGVADMKMVGQAKDFYWSVERCGPSDFTGTIRYIDQDGMRRSRDMDKCQGTLAEP